MFPKWNKNIKKCDFLISQFLPFSLYISQFRIDNSVFCFRQGVQNDLKNERS